MIPKIESQIISNDAENIHTLVFAIAFDNEHDSIACQKLLNDFLKVKITDTYHGDSKYS